MLATTNHLGEEALRLPDGPADHGELHWGHRPGHLEEANEEEGEIRNEIKFYSTRVIR